MSKSRPFFPNLKGISPLNFIVELIDEEGVAAGFDRNEYGGIIKSKLCDLGVEVGEMSNQPQFLYLNVGQKKTGIFPLYSVALHISFTQTVLVPKQGAIVVASTWEKFMVANIGEDVVESGFMRDRVIELVDIFANDYFRVNSP